MSSQRFYYWRELTFLFLMLSVLLLDLTLFEVVNPFGDEGALTGGMGLLNR